jgi:A/G-specific adenine glycosylase
MDRYTQGLMDLGATVCVARAPLCLLCPAQPVCAAAAAGTQERYPVKSKRLVRKGRDTVWLELRRRDRLWLVQRPQQGVWAGLWSLPELDSLEALAAATAGWPGTGEALAPFTHVLTHLDWTLRPVRWSLPEHVPADRLAAVVAAWPEGRWFSNAEALGLGLPAPLRKRLAPGR